MGHLESVRGLLWARKRQPEEVVYGIALAHERFSPLELLAQAIAAERAGFDAICCSDHLAPWWNIEQGPPAHCGNAWVWLGAAGQATEQVSLGPAVTALVHLSAFGPEAAEIAGRLADGIWTLADPQKAPSVIASYRRAADQAGHEPGEIILQGMASWAPDDDAALEGAREWKGALVDENYTHPVSDPADVGANGRDVSDMKFKTMGLISSDPAQHTKKIKAMQALGATAVVIMTVSGHDPLGMVRVYGDEVLPALREGRSA